MARPRAIDHAATQGSLCERLGEVLAPEIGLDVRIAAVRRHPNPYSTLFATHVLEIELTSGGTMVVFVKLLGDAQLDHPDKRRRDRELVLYRWLLSDPDLPVPRLLGIGRDPASGAPELYLEYLDGLDLRYCGLEHWHVAVARLAELHRRFAQRADVIAASDVLLAIDDAYLGAWAERAVAEVAQLCPDAVASLARAVERPEPAAALVAAQPVTLVHNDLSPKNIVAVTSSEPARVAIVDWELAGAGCGVLDLVHLAYGLAPREHRRLCDAYWRALDGSALAVDDGRERDALLAACALHKTVYRLAHARTLARDEATVRRWVEEAAACRSRL
jgi:aminoglycoside phosphotransferase (APT) family kinase protein